MDVPLAGTPRWIAAAPDRRGGDAGSDPDAETGSDPRGDPGGDSDADPEADPDADAGWVAVLDDGRVELLAPTDAREHLAGIARTDGAREAWRVPVGGAVTANLAAAPHAGRVAVGVGREGAIRVW